MATTKFWGIDEYVDYDEYADFGISGEMRERNIQRALRKGLSLSDEKLCPFCFKELKDDSYVEMWCVDVLEYSTRYYFTKNQPHPLAHKIKVGKGCFRNLQKAYKLKYKGAK